MLLGRERELEALRRLLAAARAGSSAVLAVVGEAGIGKSSLLDWTAEHAEGMRLLRARGVESEAHIPFAGLLELLRPALDGLSALPPPQAAALESALALRPAQAHDRFAVGAATLSLLASHAEAGPLAVLVDDAQWLDGSTADALRFALRRLVADPVAAILVVREGERSLVDGTDVPVLRLEGLDEAAAVELLRRRAPEVGGELAARLHRQAGGNPLALLELARAQPPEVPLDTPVAAVSSVASTYLRRARRLPERTRLALLVAATCDGDDLALVARAAAGLEVGVHDLAPAEADGLVELRGGRIEFRHPLIRSAVYGDALPELRRAAHRALAGALPDREADRRAWHLALAAAGPDEAASSALAQAGGRARERSAYEVASHAYGQAARLATDRRRRARLAVVAADAAWLGGLAERARSLLDEAAGDAEDDVLLAEIEHLRGHIAIRQGPLDEACGLLAGAAELAARHRPDSAVVMLAEAAEGAFFAGNAAAMQTYAERASRLAAATTGGRAAFFAGLAAGMSRVLSGDGERGAALIRRAHESIGHSGELDRDPRLLAWTAFGLLWLREADAGEALLEQALAAARARSSVGALPHLLTHIGIGQMAGDRYLEAQVTLDEAVRLARETGQLVILAEAVARLAWLDARCGRAQAARERAAEALALARDLGARVFEVWALTALGELELVEGDVQAALERFEEGQSALDRSAIGDPDLSPAPEQVELELRLGRDARAAALAARFAEAAAAKRQPWALARAARCRALLATDDAFEPRFAEALALHRRTPDRFELARTQLAYGARLRRAGQRLRAREELRAAHEAFEDLGARPWAALARAELAATGETARRREPGTADDLTPQELQIALLLADGRTTREAAAALFLSPKTIEYHLRNAYRKLGVHSRQELAAALARAR
ncbi:MAG TPA: AAA family ATPase [Gaiellaceae bacterium]|nr:AAA family ATPase [Gaiellaceae bacterium]